MRIHAVLTGTLLALLAVCAHAHGDKVHVRGTVVNITAASVTVKGVDGKAVEVKLVKSTIYILRVNSADQAAKAGDLAVGDMVVIHATQSDSGLAADEIKFTVPPKIPAAQASSSPR